MSTANDTIAKRRGTSVFDSSATGKGPEEEEEAEKPFLGKEGCRCIYVSEPPPYSELRCHLEGGGDGVPYSSGTVHVCIPRSYGSGGCRNHDALAGLPGEFAQTPWCYVDRLICMRESDERVFRGTVFSDLFWSYSTCNTTHDWRDNASLPPPTCDMANADPLDCPSSKPLGGITLDAAVPAYRYPNHYKDEFFLNKEDQGPQYYDDSEPFQGASIDFFAALEKFSGGDFKMDYTHRSTGGDARHPRSKFTAVVQDIENGLVDIGVGPFWVTAERLEMATFTLPVDSDEITLVIRQPESGKMIFKEAGKVFDPFSTNVYVVIFAVITLTALLAVWFTDETRRLRQAKRPTRRRKKAYVRVFLDECLSKTAFFFSAGVTQDAGDALSHKLLMFGFATFIVIVVSAHTANLASFLTRPPTIDYIRTMERAVQNRSKICIRHLTLEEAQFRWPDANFIGDREDAIEYEGVLEGFDKGECEMIAIGSNAMVNVYLMKRLCDKGLVFTDSVIFEYDIAFPIKANLAKGMSYWLYKAEKSDESITHPKSRDRHVHQIQKISAADYICKLPIVENDEFAAITVYNLAIPIGVFVVCALIAIVLHVHLQTIEKGAPRSLIGRVSTWNGNTTTMMRAAGPHSDEQINEQSDSRSDEHSDSSSDEGDQSPQIEANANAVTDGLLVTDADQPVTNAEDVATAQFQVLVEAGVLDDFVARYNGIKRQRDD